MQDMDWCQEYAFHNRRVMMDLLASAVEHVTGKTPFLNRAVNIHHNYCQCEQCSWKVGPGWTLLMALVKAWLECCGWEAAWYAHLNTWLVSGRCAALHLSHARAGQLRTSRGEL